MEQGGYVIGKTPRKLDQFFTKPLVAQTCVAKLNEKFPIDKFDCIVEPSHGNMAFVNALSVWKEKVIAFDIDSNCEETRRDFLQVLPSNFENHVLVIGNPPFGKGARLAIEFFNHAAKFAQVIAFIVPRTFRKASITNCLNLNFELVDETLLSPESFIFENNSYSVTCVFQIWNKSDVVRTKIETVNRTVDFQFVKSTADFDLAIRRVGVNAGRIFDDMSMQYSSNSHLFMSLFDKSKKTVVIDNLKSLKLEECDAKFNVAGNPSLNASEICNFYNEKF